MSIDQMLLFNLTNYLFRNTRTCGIKERLMNLIIVKCLDNSVISIKYAPLLVHLLTCNLLMASGYFSSATLMNKYHKCCDLQDVGKFCDQVFF